MDILDIRNLQLSYNAIYDESLCESMQDLGIIGEERSKGWGNEKIDKDPLAGLTPSTFLAWDERNKSKRPGKGRIPSSLGPNKNTAAVLDITKGDKRNISRSRRLPSDGNSAEGNKKMVKKDGKWVKEELYYYELVLSHLLDEGFAETVESAEAIMVNMSEQWLGDIVEGYKKLPVGK
jgi:hypothetical protein